MPADSENIMLLTHYVIVHVSSCLCPWFDLKKKLDTCDRWKAFHKSETTPAFCVFFFTILRGHFPHQRRDTRCTVYPKKYAHGFCFAVLCCSYTLTDFPISIRLTSLALWQSNDCPSASKATLMNMDKYFMWIHYEWLHNHNKAKHNKTVCIFLGIYCMYSKFQQNTENLIIFVHDLRFV